jgi:hypothetical protein
MTTKVTETVFSPWLTPVRLASTSNIAGTYYNGPNNNGVGATLTIAASSLTIDGVVCNVGDRVLLQTQTTTYQQGIYIVLSIGSTVVLQRADDQQNIEQLKPGEYVAVGAGSVNAGNFYTLVEPIPQTIGVDAMVFNADPSAGGVTFSGGASTANALAVFSDTAGNLKAQTTASTLGFGLTISTGNLAVSAGTITSSGNIATTAGTITASGAITSTAGNITSGSSGDAGTFISFPATAANGTLILAATNAGGAFNTTISNAASVGQSQVISIPDVGAATGKFIVNTATLVSGNYPVFSGTGGVIIDSGVPAQKFAQVSLTAAQFNGMYAAPVLLVAAPGANTMIIVDSIQLQMTFVSAAYAAGGVVAAQYDLTANGAGVHASSDEAAADFFAAASTVFKLNGGLVLAPFTTCANKGLYISNLTQAFTTGDSTWRIKVYYHLISTTA